MGEVGGAEKKRCLRYRETLGAKGFKKARGETMQEDAKSRSIGGTRIASQAFLPGEPVFSALLASQQDVAVLRERLTQAGRFPGQDYGFAADDLEPVSTQMTTRPVVPEQGSKRRQNG